MNLTIQRRDFAETLLMAPTDSQMPLPFDGRSSGLDPIEQLDIVERADRALLRLVAVAAGLTMIIALGAGAIGSRSGSGSGSGSEGASARALTESRAAPTAPAGSGREPARSVAPGVTLEAALSAGRTRPGDAAALRA